MKVTPFECNQNSITMLGVCQLILANCFMQLITVFLLLNSNNIICRTTFSSRLLISSQTELGIVQLDQTFLCLSLSTGPGIGSSLFVVCRSDLKATGKDNCLLKINDSSFILVHLRCPRENIHRTGST